MDDLVDVARWRRWLTSRRGTRRWQDWTERHPSLTGWEPIQVERPLWSPATDRRQHDLVALAQAGDDDAAVTLLVQLRPGLLGLVRRRQLRRGEARPDACDEVRAVFNETLCRHSLDRRPRRIAANLILDTRQRLDRSDPDRHRAGPLAPAPPPPVIAQPHADTVVGLSMLRLAIDRLPGSPDSRSVTAEAAYRAWILEEPQTTIAGDLGLEPATVAARLHRLRRVVRQEWDRAA